MLKLRANEWPSSTKWMSSDKYSVTVQLWVILWRFTTFSQLSDLWLQLNCKWSYHWTLYNVVESGIPKPQALISYKLLYRTLDISTFLCCFMFYIYLFETKPFIFNTLISRAYATEMLILWPFYYSLSTLFFIWTYLLMPSMHISCHMRSFSCYFCR